MSLHKKVKNLIRLRLNNDYDCVCWNNESGQALHQSGHTVRYGVGKGGADLVGIIGPWGKWFSMEVKVGKDRQRDNQKANQQCVEMYGGFYAIVSSEQEAAEMMEVWIQSLESTWLLKPSN